MKTKKITDLLDNVQEHIVMRDLTTFHVGGVADYFYKAETANDLIKAVKAAIKLKMPYFILGNGSNILFSDYGFAGLVIKNNSSQISVMKEKSQVIVDSGVMLSRLVMELASSDLGGLEFLYGIPGTVGGAVYGNAGAWGNAIGDFVRRITVLETHEGIPKINQYETDWLEYHYRSSKLKRLKSREKPVILTVVLQLTLSSKEEIIRRLKIVQEKRKNSQPTGFSAGSIFRNPLPREIENITGSGTKNMPEFPKERTAGFMLESCGVKKIKNNGAEVSNKHANFIINNGTAKALDIRTLIEEMRDKVNQKYKIELEEEIEYIGQW